MEKILAEVCITEHFDVHQDWENPIPGFFILASRDTSKKSIVDFSDEQSLEFIHVLRKVRKAMQEVLGIDAVQLYQSEQSEHWFHLWIFPRYPWMAEFGEKVQSIRPIVEHAKEHMMTDEMITEAKEAAARVKAALEGK